MNIPEYWKPNESNWDWIESQRNSRDQGPDLNQRYPEPLEKGILRAKHALPCFKAGTVRFDMIDVPVTHFRAKDIGTSVERLVELGYTHDIDGQPHTRPEQIVELYPQDFIPSRKAEDYLLRASAFIDELLVRFYDMEPFYEAKTADDLVGHLCGSDHTHRVGVDRIIGWSNASAGYGHTLYHAAKRPTVMETKML